MEYFPDIIIGDECEDADDVEVVMYDEMTDEQSTSNILVGTDSPNIQTVFYPKVSKKASQKYACVGCANLFGYKEFLKHKKDSCKQTTKEVTYANLPKNQNGIFCSECYVLCSTQAVLADHFKYSHGIEYGVRQVLLSDGEELETFLEWIQRMGGIKFTLKSKRLARDRTRMYRQFVCILAHSSYLASKNRKLKHLPETERCYISCTAFAKTIPQEDGTILVEYCAAHSHDAIEPNEKVTMPSYDSSHRPCSPPLEDPPVGKVFSYSDTVEHAEHSKSQQQQQEYNVDEWQGNEEEEDVYMITKRNRSRTEDGSKLDEVKRTLGRFLGKLSEMPDDICAHFIPLVDCLENDVDMVRQKLKKIDEFRESHLTEARKRKMTEEVIDIVE